MAEIVYDHQKLDAKWSEIWQKSGIYVAEKKSKKPKKYILAEFPYPSGPGMHMGHCRNFSMMDVLARYWRGRGYNVFYPIGWDAFGLPTFNYALKMGKDPHQVNKENVENFRKQLKSLALSFDWSSEINTTDPQYYKWTQWIFLQFFNHWYDKKLQKPRPISELDIPTKVLTKGKLAVNKYQNKYRLAYKAKKAINWCPSCKIGLANEEVIGTGQCERCKTIVEQRKVEQWMMRITTYADRLINDLKDLDYEESVKLGQKNWIGRKEGTNITYSVPDLQTKITVFTTRPDTIFGATFVVVAPDSQFIQKNLAKLPQKEQKDVVQYVKLAKQKTELERLAEEKKKTGQFTGIYAINPLNKQKVPIYVSDFVLGTVGTGAIMGVPAHDERDFAFAQVMNLKIKRVISDSQNNTSPITELEQVYTEDGQLINSDFLDGLSTKKAQQKMIDYLVKKEQGKRIVNYNLRDWVFSRQHYWGEPTPIMYCSKDGYVALPEDQLPLKLPKLKNYQPTKSGNSPLSKATEWRQVICPKCGGQAQLETDVMPNWAGSNWYYIRYLDPQNSKRFADTEKMKEWLPVDHYEGGQEHVTLHLLYSRFWHKFLYDIKQVPTSEPYQKRTIHGIVLGSDGQKMSKSVGNVVSPDGLVAKYGADITRLGVVFMGGYKDTFPWNTRSLEGTRRFANKFWQFCFKHVQSRFATAQSTMATPILNKLGKQVGQDIERLAFNHGVAQLMETINKLSQEQLSKKELQQLLIMTAPFMPVITEELWNILSLQGSVHKQAWPIFDKNLVELQPVIITIQINGKKRGQVYVPHGTDQSTVFALVKAQSFYERHIGDKKIFKQIFVPNKLLSLVVR